MQSVSFHHSASRVSVVLASALMALAFTAHAEPLSTDAKGQTRAIARAPRAHANGEHPAVLVARAASRRGIDSNTFIVQPPASVKWTMGPAADDTMNVAYGQPAAAPAVRIQ